MNLSSLFLRLSCTTFHKFRVATLFTLAVHLLSFTRMLSRAQGHFLLLIVIREDYHCCFPNARFLSFRVIPAIFLSTFCVLLGFLSFYTYAFISQFVNCLIPLSFLPFPSHSFIIFVPFPSHSIYSRLILLPPKLLLILSPLLFFHKFKGKG